MEQLWVHCQVVAQLMNFYVFMNKYGLMIAQKILNLYITEDMQTTYLPYSIHLIILKSFTNYLNSKHENIKFINSLSFLDILISRSENEFKPSVYYKPTFSGVYCYFNNFIYDQYKIGLIFTMLLRKTLIVSDFSRFHTEVSHLKNILEKYAVSIKLVDN